MFAKSSSEDGVELSVRAALRVRAVLPYTLGYTGCE